MYRMPFAVVALLVSACGGPVDTDPVDDVAPTVDASSPDAGADAVFPDDVVRITFSEPMDTAAVEGAYASEQLPSGDVAFSWSDGDTVLMVEPTALLEPATEYTVEIGQAATDLAGVPLEAAFSLTFTTAAVESLKVPMATQLSGTEFSNSTNSSKLMVGDSAPGIQYMPVVSFHLSELPEGTLRVVEATLSAFQNEVTGTPYEDLGGAIVASSVSFGALGAADEAEVHDEIGVFSDSAELSERQLDVTDAVRRDFGNRMAQEGLSQFRFLFDTPTDDDDQFDFATFNTNAFELDVTVYVAP